MKVLISGFDPFGGSSINPAYEAVKQLPDRILDAEIIKVEVPTVFRKGAAKLKEAIDTHHPDIVICVGQAGGRTGLCPERVAINLQDARIKDNDGGQPLDVVIKDDGEPAYFSKIPAKAITQKLHEHHIPAAVSYTAGTYVCNDLMYHLLYFIDKEYKNMRGGFIHVPYDTSQVISMPFNTPSMPISMIAEGLKLAVEATLENEEDIFAAGGETH